MKTRKLLQQVATDKDKISSCLYLGIFEKEKPNIRHVTYNICSYILFVKDLYDRYNVAYVR